MTEQQRPGNDRSEANGSPQADRPVRQVVQPTLKCPFCSGRRFDHGRDVFAGPDQLMYCRVTPPKGQRPPDGFSLPMKGAVCLDCGYVAMMVDINQLYAPIRRPQDAATALARQAGAAAHLARSAAEEAAEALERMKRGKPGGPPGEPAQPAPQAPAAPAELPAGTARAPGEAAEDGFGDLDRLLAEAERGIGTTRRDPRLGNRSIFG